MSELISAIEAQQHFVEILNRVCTLQEELIIEQAGKQIARLSPINKPEQQTSKKLDFRKAEGLGAEIWKTIETENYIQSEREAWD